MGSVFSPYYYWAQQKTKNADPENHCCINVALYGKGIRRWTMTERGKRHMSRSATHFQVGPSYLRWHGDHLELNLREVSVPIPQSVRGVVRVYPERLFNFVTPLDDHKIHHWGPLAPSARVEVELEQPNSKWKGHAYLDSNEGQALMAGAFHEWDWSRAQLKDGSTAVLYDIRQMQGPERLLAVRFKTDGSVEPFNAPPRQALPKALWRVGRSIRSDANVKAQVMHTLEDTPFYIRSVLKSGLLGQEVVSFHETLNVPKLDRTITRLMLPWRMPRVG